ncbi:High-affinity phosphodiesterase [Mycena kentingensis (nom. inval.)]|nr:High-affinity phosphodiesterase [Mycena kentingensis (nom. inval.)]
MCGHDQLLHTPPTTRSSRRRSADVGGLSLATRNGNGQGWLGQSEQLQTRYAELLSDMYTQTLNAVNNHTADCSQPRLAAESRDELIAKLDAWNFEPQSLPSEDHVAECAILIFEALFRIQGLQEAVGVSLDQIPPFIQHLRQIYRWQNSYHNFEHAVDVLQASYHYVCAAGMVPPVAILAKDQNATPTKPKPWRSTRPFNSGPLVAVLEPVDLFVLMVSAIGHDAGHPGFTNLFMKNAAAPLSAVYDGKSALEQMHVALLVRVMRAHGMAKILDGTTGEREAADVSEDVRSRGRRARKLLFDTVLATDMRVHADFMSRFTDIVVGRGDLSLENRRTTLCQALIKCADISNPSRPYYISQHWAVALQREWNAQAALEVHHDLPCTVEASGHPLQAASSQMFFIPTFVKPLLDLVLRALPEMQMYVDQCDLNLRLWTARLAILKVAEEKQLSSAELRPEMTPARTPTPLNSPSGVSLSARQPEDYSSVFPLTLPPAHSRTPLIRGTIDPGFSWNTPPSSRASAASPPPPPSSSSLSRPPSSTSASPSEEDGDSEASFTFSPASRATSTTSASPAPIADGLSDRTVVPLDGGTAAIRAAAERAGIRCGRHAQHRNSWSPQMLKDTWGSLSAGVS